MKSMVLRSLKYIFEDKDKLIEAFIISVDEIEPVVTEEEFNRYIDINLIYYSAVNKDLTEEDIIRKIQELGGKGEKIMTILQEREQKGIQQGIELGLQQGIEQGIEQGIFKVVKNAISRGMETKDIVAITGLTEKEIEEIKKEMLN